MSKCLTNSVDVLYLFYKLFRYTWIDKTILVTIDPEKHAIY